ncbi:MAG: DNA adenine methylase [Pseudomonadota bacterium]
MTISISYMGTKKALAPVVAEIAASSPAGPILDVFSGLCAVAKSVAPHRQTWTNDLQYFAQSVAHAHFCSMTNPPSRLDTVANINAHYSSHVAKQVGIASSRIAAENRALLNEDAESLNLVYAQWSKQGTLEGTYHDTGDATLFRDAYAGSYFGLLQSIEIDAIRSAIDAAKAEGQINEDEHQWLVLALAVAMNRCTNSTGHFAQPLTPKASNIRRFALQRQKSIKDNFLSALEALFPVGTRDWRLKNISLRGDANSTIASLGKDGRKKPSVVYADPPYTSDQYSRYYHLYETLLLYDYPTVEGKGRYRPDRSVSDFCLSSRVSGAFDRLIANCAEIGAELILSYPTNGLLKESRERLPAKIKSVYGREPQVTEINHQHSTMGASKGPGKQNVTEVIYRAYC